MSSPIQGCRANGTKRRYRLKFTYIKNYEMGLPLRQDIENLRKGK